MKPVVYILRLCLGASICGVLAGILGGAVVGVISGVVLQNAALGLEGAFWGGVAGAGLGAIYGLALAITDAARSRSSATSPSERTPSVPARSKPEPAPSGHVASDHTESNSSEPTSSSNLEEAVASHPVRAGHE